MSVVAWTEFLCGPLQSEELKVAEQLIHEALPLSMEDAEVAFFAGKCFIEYRRLGGGRRSPLHGFRIGAYAAVTGWKLLTRNEGQYRTYFIGISLVSP